MAKRIASIKNSLLNWFYAMNVIAIIFEYVR